jgi:hypothetical protein
MVIAPVKAWRNGNFEVEPPTISKIIGDSSVSPFSMNPYLNEMPHGKLFYIISKIHQQIKMRKMGV